MSASNGVIRIGKKGLKKFAFGEEGEPFEVDVVVAFQKWLAKDDTFRLEDSSEEGEVGTIPASRMGEYHQAAVAYVREIGGGDVTTAEALDFIARLREQYDDLVDFFRPKSSEERASPGSSEEGSETEMRFSMEKE